jgi:Zn-dependent peptidase ImmA (M78 family)
VFDFIGIHDLAMAAQYTRRLCKLDPEKAVGNIFTILEKHGILLYELDANEKFDGVSFITDSGVPLIIVNKNYPNDRKRFTIAHELGHLILHNENYFPVSEYRDKEKEANDFASEFLMPEESIKNSLRNLRLQDLGELKSYWLTSMSSIIRRAYNLKCINESKYKYFSIEFSRSGWFKNEPIKVVLDKPELIFTAKSIYENELGYSKHEFEHAFALPEDILEELMPRIEDNVIKFRSVVA